MTTLIKNNVLNLNMLSSWLNQFNNLNYTSYILNKYVNDNNNIHSYVYCVTSNILNAIKIGYWKGSINGLRSRYITPYGNNIELYYFHSKLPKMLEHKCHIYFDKYKITNELFEKKYLHEYIKFIAPHPIGMTAPCDDNI